jgi:N-carbamoylputrescine amidase
VRAGRRGDRKAARGRDEILSVEIDLTAAARSHARRVFLRDRRPDLYAAWLAR